MAGTLKATLILHSTHTPEHPTVMQIVLTNHVSNPSLALTHELWECPAPCGDRRWVHKNAWDAQSVSKPRNNPDPNTDTETT